MLAKDGIKRQRQHAGQLSLRQAFKAGVEVSQHAANAIGNSNIQQFQQAAVLCLLNPNLPTELLLRLSFLEMINFANPEAEAALWVSLRSVATCAIGLFRCIQPCSREHSLASLFGTSVRLRLDYLPRL
jgi:hypothetical protein